jgi:adenylate cyclase
MSNTESSAQAFSVSGERKLAAIMFTDIVGFSRQMGVDEGRMLWLLEIHNQIVRQAVTEHYGHVIKTVGDAFLMDFPSVVHAVQCAQQIQQQLRTHNAEKDKTEQIHVRIGIHLGDIVQKDGDVFGDGVNIASRLQALAEPDTICISQPVYKEVEKKLPLGTVVPLGKPKLKNIAERFHVYALLPEASKGIRQTLHVQRLRLAQRLCPTHRMLTGSVLLSGLLWLGWYFGIPHLLPPHSFLLTESLPLPDKPSVVVLPFTNMSEDSNYELLADGIVEGMTTGLAKLPGLFIISRTSAFTYKRKGTTVREVSRELGVRYVVEGSVQKAANDRIRITAQLIDATTDQHVWAENYDRPAKDIFAVRDDITRKLVTHIAPRITKVEQALLERTYAGNLEAYNYFVRGSFSREHGGDKEKNAEGRQLCQKAVEIDPTYAHAYVCIGLTYWHAWIFGWTQDPQALEEILNYGQKAVALDDSLSPAHELIGLHYLGKREYERALPELQRAVELGPNWSSPHAALSVTLNATGRAAEAIPLLEQAVRLNPRHPLWAASYFATLGNAYRLTGQYDKAIETLKKAMSMHPSGGGALSLIATYSEAGQDAEAKALAEQVLQKNPQFSLATFQKRFFFLYKDPANMERFLAALRKAGLK